MKCCPKWWYHNRCQVVCWQKTENIFFHRSEEVLMNKLRLHLCCLAFYKQITAIHTNSHPAGFNRARYRASCSTPRFMARSSEDGWRQRSHVNGNQHRQTLEDAKVTGAPIRASVFGTTRPRKNGTSELREERWNSENTKDTSQCEKRWHATNFMSGTGVWGKPLISQSLEKEQAFPEIHRLPCTLSTHTQTIKSHKYRQENPNPNPNPGNKTKLYA